MPYTVAIHASTSHAASLFLEAVDAAHSRRFRYSYFFFYISILSWFVGLTNVLSIRHIKILPFHSECYTPNLVTIALLRSTIRFPVAIIQTLPFPVPE